MSRSLHIYGMESWVYGYPIVLMGVTREVLTAAPAPNSEGAAAPINQLAKMPHYVSPDFKNVVRISTNSLWTTGWVEPRGRAYRPFLSPTPTIAITCSRS